MRLFLSTLLFFLLIFFGYLGVNKFLNPNINYVEQINTINIYKSSTTVFKKEITEIRQVEKAPKDKASLKYFGWIPDWDMVDGFNTLKNNPHITSVSPFWFDLAENGSLLFTQYTNWSEMRDYTKAKGIDLVPTITSFDRDTLTKVLNSKENTDRFIEETVSYASTYDYQGIDLDFEVFYFNDQKLFIELLKELKLKLNNLGKKLYISILARWGDNIDYGQTRSLLDFKLIKDLVDVFIIQGYAYSSSNSETIGPVGPLDWQEDIIRYAIKSGVSRDKIVLGTHTYAQDWSDRPIQRDLQYYTEEGLVVKTPNPDIPVAYYHNGVDRLYSNYQIQEEFIDSWGEMTAKYNFGGQMRVAVYPNNKSIELRKDLASEYGILGVSYWRLGDEGSLKL